MLGCDLLGPSLRGLSIALTSVVTGSLAFLPLCHGAAQRPRTHTWTARIESYARLSESASLICLLHEDVKDGGCRQHSVDAGGAGNGSTATTNRVEEDVSSSSGWCSALLGRLRVELRARRWRRSG